MIRSNLSEVLARARRSFRLARSQRAAASIVMGTSCWAISCTTPAPELRTGRAPEATSRHYAIAGELPSYPNSSADARTTGVAVAKVLIAPDGTVTEVTILEAPDGAIEDAVQASLATWVYSFPPTDGFVVDFDVLTKVTLYFEFIDGTPTVLNPSEMTALRLPGTLPAGRFVHGDANYPLPVIARTGLAGILEAKPDLVIIDIDGDGRAPNSTTPYVSVPANRLAVHAGLLWESSQPIVIDCDSSPIGVCARAYRTLRRLNFASVALLMDAP